MKYAAFAALAWLVGESLALAGGNRPVGPRAADPGDGRNVGVVAVRGPENPPLRTRERIIVEGLALVGQVEASGKNDGPVVDAVLDTVGLKGTGAPYCAATNRFLYDRAGFRDVGPRSAWSPDWTVNPTWTRASGGRTPLPGDAWGIYFPAKGRVAHTGLVRVWGAIVLTLEGNTSPDAMPGSPADRNGDGFWSKRRLQRQIYAVRNWIDP